MRKISPVLKPLNRHLTIILHKSDKKATQEKPQVLLPDGYSDSSTDRYAAATVLEVAPDCSSSFQKIRSLETSLRTIIVDSNMVEEIVHRDKKYNVILENYVIGFLRGINEPEDL